MGKEVATSPVLLGASSPLARPISHFQTFCSSKQEKGRYENTPSGTRAKLDGWWPIGGINAYSSTGQGDEEDTDAASCEQRRRPLSIASLLDGFEENRSSRFRSINNPRESSLRGDEMTTPIHPSKRQKTRQGAVSEASVGPVPSSGQRDVAAVSPLDLPLNESRVGELSSRDAESTASPQPSVSGYSNAPGLVTLRDRSCLPIRYLKGQAQWHAFCVGEWSPVLCRQCRQ